MPWNRLDGSKVGPGSHPFYHTSPPPNGFPGDVQPPVKKRTGLRITISILLVMATISTFPQISALGAVASGIVYYYVMKWIFLRDKGAPRLALPWRKKPTLKETQPPHVEEEKKAEPEKQMSEVEKIITDGRLYLEGIRKVNNRIAENSPEAFRQIARMEECAEKIFDYISDHPEDAPQIRKFMNYYLPTLLKLLNSYDTLKQQGIDGNHINASITEIEGILHTMAIAFEKQLDNLFEDDQLDISTDIEVLRQMLAQEGLSDDEMDMSKMSASQL